MPTLFPKLVDARTYTERMFHTIFLDKLNDADSREAIIRPIQDAGWPVMFNEESAKTISKISGGYPFFIQFICKEVYDVWVQKASFDEELPTVPVDEIMRKLDSDFFAGRWTRVTDRQRELLNVIANLENCDAEFMVQDIVSRSRAMSKKPFGSSHVNQMLVSLGKAGLIYKNRFGKYLFAAPLMSQFVRRQAQQYTDQEE